MVLSFLKVNIQTSTEGALNRECSSLQSISGHSRPVYSACIAGFGIDTAIAVRPQVQNLLSNAIKYGKDGKHVYVELECLEQEVQIRVTNYGLVIPEESIKHLFDKFYRVERSRNVKTGGTGLGLNIAQEIVHLHGGRIQVTSGASGTCFTIALPLHKEEEEE